MTRDRFDIAMRHATDLGIEVEWADLGARRRGKCHSLSSRIVLNSRLTMTQAAATCIHEVAHHVFGDTESTPARERRAWEYGASLVIEPGEYAAAEAIVGCHPAALAIELDTTAKLIESWRAWWTRCGCLATSLAVKGPDSRSESSD